MSNKENNFKEKFKQALISTAKVISDDYKVDEAVLNKRLNLKKTDFFEGDVLERIEDITYSVFERFSIFQFIGKTRKQINFSSMRKVRKYLGCRTCSCLEKYRLLMNSVQKSPVFLMYLRIPEVGW